jgi:hypothetical protein
MSEPMGPYAAVCPHCGHAPKEHDDPGCSGCRNAGHTCEWGPSLPTTVPQVVARVMSRDTDVDGIKATGFCREHNLVECYSCLSAQPTRADILREAAGYVFSFETDERVGMQAADFIGRRLLELADKPKPYVCSQEPHPGVEFYGTDGGCAECDYRPATKPR